MEITDKYIEDLFAGTNFGAGINGSTEEKRKILNKSIGNQCDGYWSGSTIYHIMVHGGFIVDAKRGSKKSLTKLGYLFLKEFNK